MESRSDEEPPARVAPLLERIPNTKRGYRPPIAFLLVLIAIVSAGGWIVYSDAPTAQELREDFTGARAQIILDKPISINPNGYSYYQFTVPAGAVDVAVSGEFSVIEGPSRGKNPDNSVEVFVLTTTAFIAWRDGYATGNFFESGRVANGSISASLPAGAGDYYLVFNNRFSSRTPKAVRATVLLRYKALLSESLARLRETIVNWLGFN